jgi:hypothetical protein
MLFESGAKLPEYYNTFSLICIQDDRYYGHGQIHHVCSVVDQNLCQEEDTEGASPQEWPDSHASVAAIAMSPETVVEREEEVAAIVMRLETVVEGVEEVAATVYLLTMVAMMNLLWLGLRLLLLLLLLLLA